MKKIILLLLLSINSLAGYAHIDLIRVHKYGNTEVHITASYLYDEVIKAEIYGQLINLLAEELNSKSNIYLNLRHISSPEFQSKYAIRFSNQKKKKGEISITVYASQFNVVDLLKLTEFAITQKQTLQKLPQDTVLMWQRHEDKRYAKSIDQSLINETLSLPLSEKAQKALSTKIYYPGNKGSGFSCFFQNNKYHIFTTDGYLDNRYVKGEYVRQEFSNIFQFTQISSNQAIVFDTDSTFYFLCYTLGADYKDQSSDKHTIVRQETGSYRPYIIHSIGDLIIISYVYYGLKTKETSEGKISSWSNAWHRHLIYIPDEDVLIDDLNTLLKEYIPGQDIP